MCESYHHGDDKEHVSYSNLKNFIFGGSDGYLQFRFETVVHQGHLNPIRQRKRTERIEVLHTCIHLDLSPKQCVRGKEGKLDTKDTKCLFLDYCKGTKAYRLMCLQTKNSIK